MNATILAPIAGLDAFLADAAKLLPTGALLRGEACQPYEADASSCRGQAAAVLLPDDTATVSALMRAAVRHRVRLVPQGNRTGLVGGAVPDGSGRQVVLSLARMRRLRAFDPLNRSAVAEAGMALSELNRLLEPHGLWLPIDVGSDPAIGGLIGANTGGSRLLRHGDVRRNLLGLEIVLADEQGSVLDLLAPLRKRNAGIDLKQLFVGSGGALGVVTAAAWDLKRRDASVLTLLAALPSRAAALDVLDACEQRFGEMLSAFEVMGESALMATLRHFPALRHPLAESAAGCYALVEIASAMPGLDSMLQEQAETLLATLLQRGLLIDAAFGRPDSLWALRDSLPLALAAEGLPLSFDVGLPRSRLPAFHAAAERWLADEHPALRLYDFGHFGDGGCHLIVLLPRECAAGYSPARLAMLKSALYRLVADHGGAFSAEHGVGPLNAAFYRKHTSDAAQELAAGLQRLLDPAAALGRHRYD
ncbi:FAD-binding oxidoreductase [Chromobacterium sinusclupearum]|uniref:FAD-binding oxidoreductase n=1 Tax=Chromobacterium sinusclupearum TaxID=2077146 RepID=A0A2K4MIX3_9NEIS|nr:FAD-binding oxidoreductase [Chromobacterium sinusclupearum]POA97036.1 FAD-binding oxidoreductase [Chromobacterium sinusclupearum]